MPESLRACFREPIPEIFDAARYLDEAVSAHLVNRREKAQSLLAAADMRAIRMWTESIWGKGHPFAQPVTLQKNRPVLPKDRRVKVRMPNAKEKRALHTRDGYHCRFCGIPVVRKEIRIALHRFYPTVVTWGRRNAEQHAAFQAMWLQYDHVIPHARGGDNELGNVIITCAPCNFGRSDHLVEEVGLFDPRSREPIKSEWDGLERMLSKKR